MLDFLCNSSPRYDYGEKTPAPSPTTPSVLDMLGLSWLWQAPTPKYDGLPAAGSSSSPGFLCWLFGPPTPVYQTSAPPVPTPQIPRQMPPRDHSTER